MALARVKTWSSGEVLTAPDLNAEFNNLLNNARDLISPLTASLDLNGVELIMDGDADSSLTADTDDRVDLRLGGVDVFRFDGSIASTVNGIDFVGAATGNPAQIKATGETNIGVRVVPKGTGRVQAADGTDSTKILALNVSGVTTATTRTMTVPDADFTPLYKELADAVGDVLVGTAADAFTRASASSQPVNCSIAASVAGNILTIALKGRDGNDPSATNPVLIPFRSATAGTGDYSWVLANTALSIAIPDTATLGTVNADMARIYVYAVNDGGTLRLGVYNPVSGTGNTVAMKSLNVGDVQSSTQIGTGSDSAQTLYTDTAAVTNKAVCWLGFVEIVQATAGTWATAPALVTLAGNGVKYSGDLVQVVNAISAGSTTTSSSDSDVTNATVSITPSSRCNLLECHIDYHQLCSDQTGVAAGSTATPTDGTPTAYRTAKQIKGTDTASNIIVEANGSFHFYAKPDSTSAQVVKLRHASVNGSDTITTDDVGIVVKEIFA